MKKNYTLSIFAYIIIIGSLLCSSYGLAQVVVIDIGHGYCNHAEHRTQGPGSYNHDTRLLLENETAFVVGTRLKRELEATCPSLRVHLTRTTNKRPAVWIGVTARKVMSNDWGADRFLSIHTNASPPCCVGSGTGTEVLWCDRSTPSNSRITTFGQLVQDEMVDHGDWIDRGVREDKGYINFHLGVLNGNNAVGVLSEIGFGDNSGDAKKLGNSAWRDRFVQAYKDALMRSLSIDCEGCPKDINKTGTIATGTYHAERNLSSTGTVASGKTVTFKAGSAITLKPGFTARSGSRFTAKIEPCSDTRATSLSARVMADSAVPESTELATEQGLVLSPNPTRGTLHVKFATLGATPVQLDIKNISGHVVHAEQIEGITGSGMHEATLDLGHLPAGIYFCSYDYNGTTLTQKFIIQE